MIKTGKAARGNAAEMLEELGGTSFEKIGKRGSGINLSAASSMVAEFREGDGVNPKEERRREKTHDKESTLVARRAQLCRQAERALSLALTEFDSESFGDLQIQSITQEGGSRPLEVTLEPKPGSEVEPEKVIAQLESAKPYLRAAVAEAITRKKAPDLKFTIAPAKDGAAS